MTETQQDESKTLNFSEKKKISLYSIGVNLFLSLIKIAGGIFSGSAALTADGVHSLSDLAASVSVYIGIVISNKKYEAFPQGLYKVENLVALVSALAIFFAGYEIAKDVLFGETTQIKNLSVALIVIGITVVSTYLYSRWEKKKAIELNSPSLLADSEHIKTDFYTALVVLIGVLGQFFGYPIIEKIQSILSNDSKIKTINRITGRNAGSFKFVQLDLALNTDSLSEAHDIAHSIEDKIKAQMPFVEKVVIHYQ